MLLKSTCIAAVIAVATIAGACKTQRTAPPTAPPVTTAAVTYVPVAAYDIKRDPSGDLRDAIAEAGRTHKRILLEVGGEWCVWCHIMDGYFDAHPDLRAARDDRFVTVKINYSEENKNEAFLAKYPKVAGYPHIFVLDSDGTLLHSQDTAALESGRSYDLAKFSAFLTDWKLN
jgi:thiol:disulfide interchange protein